MKGAISNVIINNVPDDNNLNTDLNTAVKKK